MFANSVDPDQTPQNTASDQGLHCLHHMADFPHFVQEKQHLSFCLLPTHKAVAEYSNKTQRLPNVERNTELDELPTVNAAIKAVKQLSSGRTLDQIQYQERSTKQEVN